MEPNVANLQSTIENLKKVFQENVEYERHRSAELRIEHAKTRKLRESATRNEELMREEASLAKRERDVLKEELEKARQTLAEQVLQGPQVPEFLASRTRPHSQHRYVLSESDESSTTSSSFPEGFSSWSSSSPESEP